MVVIFASFALNWDNESQWSYLWHISIREIQEESNLENELANG